MGCLKLSYYPTNFEVTKNYFKKELTSNKSVLNTHKRYELSNPITGNIHVVISDRKLAVDDGVYDSNGNQTSTTPDGIFDYYEPDVVFAADYYDGVGMVMPGRLFVTQDHRYGAQGSEVDQEIDGSRDRITTYYRNANLKTMRWDSPDPKPNASWSPYAMMQGNPVLYNDILGDTVISVFNKSKNTLRIMDMDHYKKGLPYKVVSAKNYTHGGIRDKDGNLTHNQILLVKNVFSGGESNEGSVSRNPDRPMQRPIPNGSFSIVDNNADTRHTGWYRLDSQDEFPYNDKDDATGRDGFRLHLGSESWGCVTCDATIGDRSKEWSTITKIFENTSTTTVPDNRGMQWLNPFSTLINYGTMKVIGEDKTPTTPKTEP